MGYRGSLVGLQSEKGSSKSGRTNISTYFGLGRDGWPHGRRLMTAAADRQARWNFLSVLNQTLQNRWDAFEAAVQGGAGEGFLRFGLVCEGKLGLDLNSYHLLRSTRHDLLSYSFAQISAVLLGLIQKTTHGLGTEGPSYFRVVRLGLGI
jgi:hypothetical protein